VVNHAARAVPANFRPRHGVFTLRYISRIHLTGVSFEQGVVGEEECVCFAGRCGVQLAEVPFSIANTGGFEWNRAGWNNWSRVCATCCA
jgi:hypothetical protein